MVRSQSLFDVTSVATTNNVWLRPNRSHKFMEIGSVVGPHFAPPPQAGGFKRSPQIDNLPRMPPVFALDLVGVIHGFVDGENNGRGY